MRIRKQDAVVPRIEVLGEASKRLSKTFRDAHPEIPWKSMIGMRNVLIHDYHRIMLDEVWQVATHDVPELLGIIEPFIEKLED